MLSPTLGVETARMKEDSGTVEDYNQIKVIVER